MPDNSATSVTPQTVPKTPGPAREAPVPSVLTGPDRTEPALPDNRSLGKMIIGYRVQIHSFRGRTAAIEAQQQVRERVKELPIEVHLEEEASYYKVRVGDFTSRSDADRLARILKTQKGYPDVWVVKTRVYASGQ